MNRAMRMIGPTLLLSVLVALPLGCRLPAVPDDGDSQSELPPVADCAGNQLPVASLTFPGDGGLVPGGTLLFRWQVTDPEGRSVRSRLYLSESPDVFATTPIQTLITGANQPFVNATADVAQGLTYYWGVEIDDGCETIRRPADGQGQPFTVGIGGDTRADLRAVQLCPRSDQTARPVTTFLWADFNISPAAVQVFVSRPGVTNPFDNPLLVRDVIPPTSTSLTLEPTDALTLGQTYAWGLRVETTDGVLFSGGGEAGVSFLVGPNTAPTGALLDPPSDTALENDATSFVLRWTADPENCADTLTSRVVLQYLGTATAPIDLANSELAFDVPVGAFELNLLAVLPLDQIQAGRWAWGVIASDGFENLLLPAGDGTSFRTFIRRFDDCNGNGIPDDLDIANCDGDPACFDCNENGIPDGCEIANCPPNDPGCRDCNENGLLDACDIAACSPDDPDCQDCNSNGVPDSCDILACDPDDPACQDCNENGIPDACEIANCPPDDPTCQDCDGNGVPDECDILNCDPQDPFCQDCNENGRLDGCELSTCPPDDPDCQDCNGNGILDACDIANCGPENPECDDCNLNGVPDGCEFLTTEFEDVTGTFAIGDSVVTEGIAITFTQFAYGPICEDPVAQGTATIAEDPNSFCAFRNQLTLSEINAAFAFALPLDGFTALVDDNSDGGIEVRINGECRGGLSLFDLAGQTIGGVRVEVRSFSEGCTDLVLIGPVTTFEIGAGNGSIVVDNVRAFLDADGNFFPDACDLRACSPDNPFCQDCNANGVLDGMDIRFCQSDPLCQDCDFNGVPDGCEDPNCF